MSDLKEEMTKRDALWEMAQCRDRKDRVFYLGLLNTREDSIHGHHQMVNTKIRLICSLKPKMEKLYTVNKNKTRS